MFASRSGSRGGHTDDPAAATGMRSYCCCKWKFDFVYVVLMFIFIAASPMGDGFHHFIHEQDPALSFPYIPDTQASCPAISCLAVIALIVGPLACVLVQFAMRRAGVKGEMATNYGLVQLAYWQTVMTTVAITAILKNLNGRPRPNFFAALNYRGFRVYMDSVKPDGAYDKASYAHYMNATTAGVPAVVDRAHCEVDDSDWNRLHLAMFASFPSGHSSTSAASMVFLALLLMHALPYLGRSHNRAWKNFLFFVPLFIAAWVASSRTRDYWHNFGDVLAGSILGTSVAISVFYSVFVPSWGRALADMVQRLSEASGLIVDKADSEAAGLTLSGREDNPSL